MDWVLAAGLTLFNLVFLLSVLIGIPGTWLMVAATALVAWLRRVSVDGQPMITVWVLAAMIGLALVGELIEFLAGVIGSKRFGGTNRSAVGALVGTLVGGILGTVFLAFVPLFGSLVGACLGAAAGAILIEVHDRRPFREALRSGTGAGVGRLAGSVAKFGCGVVMWILATVAAFWP
jgi:uncharacterized protein